MTDALQAARQLVLELEASEQKRAKYLHSVSLRDSWRSKVHALVVDLVEALEKLGYSRARIAKLFDVHPVTLLDYVASGDKPRNQIPGWFFPAIAKLPEPAWELAQRTMLAWRRGYREDR